jgi:hypothetical protein
MLSNLWAEILKSYLMYYLAENPLKIFARALNVSPFYRFESAQG